MRSPAIWLLLAAACGWSCGKKQAPDLDPNVVGVWTWEYSSFGNEHLETADSGIVRILTFRSDGTYTLRHNDSLGPTIDLRVLPNPVLLSRPVTDSGTWQVLNEGAGCAPDRIPLLAISNGNAWQYAVTADSLYVDGNPCIASVRSTYYK